MLTNKPLKVTIADYWQVINEGVPTLMNERDKYHKNVRFLVLYTEYFKTKNVLDTCQLAKKINEFGDYKEILDYVKIEVPSSIIKTIKPNYAKRFFYTQSGYYKSLLDYAAQNFLYKLTHAITLRISHGQI